MKVKKQFYIMTGLSVMVLLILLSSIMTGCYAYRSFTLRDAVAECSFECPVLFGPISVERVSLDFTSVWGSLPSGFADIYMSITVQKISDAFTNYHELLNWSLSISQQGQSEDEFELIEFSTITVDEAQGEQIVFRYYVHYGPRIEDGEIVIPKPSPRISREAFFENNGILWNIEVNCVTEKNEQASIYFEHILDTFQFLD